MPAIDLPNVFRGDILAAIADGVTVHDRQFRIVYQNQAMRDLFGDQLGATCFEAYRQQSQVCLGCPVQACFADEAVHKSERAIELGGRILRMESSAAPLRGVDGAVVAVVEVLRDISQRKATELALRDSEERLQLVLEGSREGFWDWDKTTGTVQLSPRFLELLGYRPGELPASSAACKKLIHPEDLPRAQTMLRDHLAGVTPGLELELRMQHRCGDWIWLLQRGKLVARNPDGSARRLAGTASDIGERKRYEENLRYLSTHDPLTNLYNRAYFEAELTRLTSSRQYPVSIVMADVDGLKPINDRFGHLEGDRLLQQAAQSLRETFRGEDIVARIGGDEFAVLLPGTDAGSVKEAIKRVRQLQAELNQSNALFTLSISLGAATAQHSGQLQDALKRADARMYHYKFRRKSQQPL